MVHGGPPQTHYTFLQYARIEVEPGVFLAQVSINNERPSIRPIGGVCRHNGQLASFLESKLSTSEFDRFMESGQLKFTADWIFADDIQDMFSLGRRSLHANHIKIDDSPEEQYHGGWQFVPADYLRDFFAEAAGLPATPDLTWTEQNSGIVRVEFTAPHNRFSPPTDVYFIEYNNVVIDDGTIQTLDHLDWPLPMFKITAQEIYEGKSYLPAHMYPELASTKAPISNLVIPYFLIKNEGFGFYTEKRTGHVVGPHNGLDLAELSQTPGK